MFPLQKRDHESDSRATTDRNHRALSVSCVENPEVLARRMSLAVYHKYAIVQMGIIISINRRIFAALVVLTCAKVLCIPSYRSTDFDVHRNWLAITKHFPLEEWYFNDGSRHTLDYPPSFAFFEYVLSNNPITGYLVDSGRVDNRCLALLKDNDNEPTMECVAFHRVTVILSDVALWIGAYIAAWGDWNVFLLIVGNPGLFWLDHVHFQYNGMLLGILLASLGLLLRGATKSQASTEYHVYHLMAAFLYAILLTMKHLYLPLAPLFFIYLLSNYCIDTNGSFSLSNFALMAVVTGSSLVAPFLPFVVYTRTYSPLEQMIQMLKRLFPFGRGLVHDYWAANVWALWTLGEKLTKRLPITLPEVSPSVCAICLLAGLTPGLLCAWKASASIFLRCVVFSSLSAFMLAYHVHEKAIMTAIIPLTLLVGDRWQTDDVQELRKLFLRMNVLGLLGLFPLLFRPVELTLKITSYGAYVAFSIETLGIRALSWSELFGITVLVGVLLFLEVIHPFVVYPAMEFLPLLCTSIVCAVGLIGCWMESGLLLCRNHTQLACEKAARTK